MRRSQALLPILPLALLLACGGASNTPAANHTATVATSLAYTDPGGSYQLVRNTTLSTATHLVLDLTGPAAPVSARGFGLVLTLGASTKAIWVPVTAGGSNYLAEGTVFALGSGPRAIVGRTLNGGTDLQLGLFQKGTAVPAVTLGAAVLGSVALDLAPGTPPGAVTLSAVAGKAFIQGDDGVAVAITPAIGTLVAQ
jgi:hypothetical protein